MRELMAERARWIRKHIRAIDIVAAVGLSAAALLLISFSLLGPRNLDLDYIGSIVPRLLDAAQITFFVTSIAFLAGMAIGFFVGWAKTVRPAAPVVGERPFGVMVLAVVSFALALSEGLTAGSMLASAYSPPAELSGQNFASLWLFGVASAAIAPLYVLAGLGLWRLRRWGWYLSIAVNALDAAVAFVLGGVGGLSAVSSAAILIVPAILILYLFIAAGAFGIIAPRMARGANRVVRRFAEGYVEIMRGTPLFVQIVFIWTILLFRNPGIQDPRTLALVAGIVAMTINTGAYQGEIFRGGLQTVHSGQVEAGRSLGLSRWQTMRHVVLPQALRLVIPPLTNEYIALLKSSSLLFFIGLAELTFVSKQLSNREVRIFEVFVVVTAIYLLFTVPLSNIVQALERKFRIPGLGIQVAREKRVRPAVA